MTRGRRSRSRGRWIAAAVLSGVLLGAVTPAAAQIPASFTQRLLVPAYFEPGATYDGWNGKGWSQLIASSQVGMIVFNPADGPGTQSWVATYRSSIISARAAGKKVIGYVKTSYGARPLADVYAEIDNYYRWYLDAGGRPLPDGIFVDEVELVGRESDPVAWSNQYNYFAAVRDRIKGWGGAGTVVLNPGSAQDFGIADLGDVIVNFESDVPAFSTFSPDAWQADLTPDRLCALVFNAPSTSLSAMVQTAKSLNYGWVYVTPDYLSKSLVNPWDTLPADPYWTNEKTLAAGTAAVTLPPAITAAAAREDNGTVAIDLSHVFVNTSTTSRYRRAFLDTDLNRATGYPVATIGADYLVENTSLWRWTGTTWTYVAAVTPSPSSGTQTSWRVARSLLGGVQGAIRVKLDIEEPISKTPVNRYSPLLNVAAYAGPPPYTYSNDATRVYYSLTISGTYSYRHVFLDTDQNAATGYSFGGVGADYMIENGTLYRNNGAGWSWTAVRSSNQVCSGSRCDWSALRSDLGETKSSGEATALVFHASGTSPEYASKPVTQLYTP